MKTPVALFAIAMSFETATAGSTVKTIPKDYDPAQKEECIVIGRVDYVTNPHKPEKPHGNVSNKMANPMLTVKNEATRKSYYIDLEGPRWEFYVALPPGKYKVTEWTSGNLTAAPQVVFELAPCKPEPDSKPEQAPCPARYIGTLKYARETSKGAFWKGAMTQTIPGSWEVVDEYDEALKKFHEEYPHLSCTAEKSLFRLTD